MATLLGNRIAPVGKGINSHLFISKGSLYGFRIIGFKEIWKAPLQGKKNKAAGILKFLVAEKKIQ